MKRIGLAFLPLSVIVHAACAFDTSDNCEARKLCADGGGSPTTTSVGGAGGAGASGGNTGGDTGGGGQGAGGGTPSCTDNPELCGGATPVCDAGECVECTPANTTACTGETPACDPTTRQCGPCRYHSDCPTSACNAFTGACLSAAPKTVGSGQDYPTLTAAVASVSTGGEGVFSIVGSDEYTEALTLGDNKVVAILGASRPSIRANGGPPTVTVFNGATLLLANLDLRGNTSAVALQASGRVLFDGVEVSQNAGGGINATSTADLLLRTSMVAANGAADAPAIALTGSTLDVLYSAIGGTFGTSSAISCAANPTVTIRNSVVFNRNTETSLASCSAATITNSAGDKDLGGTGNTTFTVAAGLFTNLNNGNLRLTATGASIFADVARWRTGDPPADIDGTPRPTADDTPDECGADQGP